MAYKEIQVPNGTVRAIYEDFLKHVKPLAEQQQRKNAEQAAINEEHILNEQKLREQYRELSGSKYNRYLDMDDSYHSTYSKYSFGMSYTATDALRDTERMLNAVKFSDGDLTMTVQQVEAMENVRTGNLLKYIEEDVARPVKVPRSLWQTKIDMLLEEQKVKPVTPPVMVQVDTREEPKSFVGSFVGFIALFALVVALLKTCGG